MTRTETKPSNRRRRARLLKTTIVALPLTLGVASATVIVAGIVEATPVQAWGLGDIKKAAKKVGSGIKKGVKKAGSTIKRQVTEGPRPWAPLQSAPGASAVAKGLGYVLLPSPTAHFEYGRVVIGGTSFSPEGISPTSGVSKGRKGASATRELRKARSGLRGANGNSVSTRILMFSTRF